MANEFDCMEKLRDLLSSRALRNCYPIASHTVERLVAIGGGSKNIEYFCPIANQWRHWYQMPFDEMEYDAAVFDNKLYMLLPTSNEVR